MMNAEQPSSSLADAGDRMAERIATGIASLLGIAIVAAGGYLVTLSTSTAELRVQLGNAEREIFELHDALRQFPKALDLIRCGERLAIVEQQMAILDHRLGNQERAP